MTPTQLKKTLATLLGVGVNDITAIKPVAYQVTIDKTVPGTTHVRSSETRTVTLS